MCRFSTAPYSRTPDIFPINKCCLSKWRDEMTHLMSFWLTLSHRRPILLCLLASAFRWLMLCQKRHEDLLDMLINEEAAPPLRLGCPKQHFHNDVSRPSVQRWREWMGRSRQALQSHPSPLISRLQNRWHRYGSVFYDCQAFFHPYFSLSSVRLCFRPSLSYLKGGVEEK